MRTEQLRSGDEVEINIRGVQFPARFEGRLEDGRVQITPLRPGYGYHAAGAHQVVRKLDSTAVRPSG